MIATSFFHELVKLSSVTDDEARRSLDRLDTLERTRPTARQVGRYAAIGAVAAPAIGALANVVKGGRPVLDGAGTAAKLRDVASTAVKGGLAASAIPVARTHLDRKAEIGTLRKYVAGDAKVAFRTSSYSGPLNPGFLRMESDLPPLRIADVGRAPAVRGLVGPRVGSPSSPTRGGFLLASPAPAEKRGAAATTPAGRFRQSAAVGLPRKAAPPGPSLADVSKPIGFGRKLPGALKASI